MLDVSDLTERHLVVKGVKNIQKALHNIKPFEISNQVYPSHSYTQNNEWQAQPTDHGLHYVNPIQISVCCTPYHIFNSSTHGITQSHQKVDGLLNGLLETKISANMLFLQILNCGSARLEERSLCNLSGAWIKNIHTSQNDTEAYQKSFNTKRWHSWHK